MAGKTHHRTDSPTGVALSNSEFKKLFTPSRDDETPPHYATYSRLQAKELLQSLDIVRNNTIVVQAEKKSESRIQSPKDIFISFPANITYTYAEAKHPSHVAMVQIHAS